MKNGFVRVACATPEIKLADCKNNAKKMLSLIKEANEKNVSIIVFPELSISGYTCGNLFFNKDLQKTTNEALSFILKETKSYEMLIIVGLACKFNSSLYNCAAVICKGRILGIVPKKNIPNYSQYTEMKFFAEGKNKGFINIIGQEVAFGNNLIFVHEKIPELKVGVEICEDFWVSTSPSNDLATAGATIIANLSASDEVVGKAQKRRMLINAQSAKLVAAYLYANVGRGESSTDLVFSGHNVISENGEILAQSSLFSTGLTIADLDLQVIESERLRLNTFKNESLFNEISFNLSIKDIETDRKILKNPFLKVGPNESIGSLCDDITNLQVEGLISRIRNTGIKKIVIGVSGGIDSTNALMIAVKAFKKLSYDKKEIIAVIMPGMGTSSKTKNNSIALVNSLETSILEIPIKSAIENHFKDIGKVDNKCDTTYENAQARERTQILMDLANMKNAMVLGTGDLSEIALGFSTYNGDHMSMYNVNSGVPKTVIKEILYNESKKIKNKTLKNVILNILETPISPELLPTKSNVSTQLTEEIIGPYELHDFFLYYFLKYGFSFEKILCLASITFGNEYKKDEISKYLLIFMKRFFKNQFKRSCQPDGPKVLDISLSSRGCFIMPSDMQLPENFI